MGSSGETLGADELAALSSNAPKVAAVLDQIVEQLGVDARLSRDNVARPHALLVLVRRGRACVIIAPASVFDQRSVLLKPYQELLARRQACLVLLGCPQDRSFEGATEGDVAAVLAVEPSQAEILGAVHRGLELLQLRQASTLPPDDADTGPDMRALPSDSMLGADVPTLLQRVVHLELLHKVGVALSAEQNKDRLVEMILLEAKQLCNADGGTLYIRTDDDHLEFAIMRNDSLGIALGGTTGAAINWPPIPMYDPHTRAPNLKNVATAAAVLKQSVNISDAYHAEGLDFSGTKVFDQRNAYRSKSFLTIPMVNNDNYVIGVLQLLNATDPASGEVVAFGPEQQRIVEALASQAAIALNNKNLLDDQRELLDSFIKLIAAAIDAKSPYTGGHCERVPVITEMLARSVCQAREGPFQDFALTDEEWYELHIAAWLHDCGKVTTPVHVMDKASKLETIHDRVEIVRARFETLRREAEIGLLRRLAEPEVDEQAARREYELKLVSLDEDLAFLEAANMGGESLSLEQQQRIRQIGSRPYRQGGQWRTVLSHEELENLCVSRGTLTARERIIVNMHIVQTIRMLEALPFPRNLRRVPEYAGGHHEKMDGSGYPRGVYAGDMSIPARIMAIADVFEALTAQDRPYKRGKTLSEAMRIMGFMKRDNHLDPDLFDHFVRSGVYREYGCKYLPPELVDEVDEAALLSIVPKPIDLPQEAVRVIRKHQLLREYAEELERATGRGTVPSRLDLEEALATDPAKTPG
jgi:HD-GYP domain-containing protein (c-di-GMP phosphodiesterase class II)